MIALRAQRDRRTPAPSGVVKSRLTRRYAALQMQLAAIGPVSQGSVASHPPGSWRWTFKVKGKTACVALSGEQATEMLQAIENHKQVEEIVREMREITRTLILETVPESDDACRSNPSQKHVKLGPFYSNPIQAGVNSPPPTLLEMKF